MQFFHLYSNLKWENIVHWTKREKQSLRKQIKDKVPITSIRVGDRTLPSIRYQIYNLKLYVQRWKKKEIAYLKKSAKEGKIPFEIHIPGRTKKAIRNKLIRMGFWKPRRRKTRKWKMSEVKLLKHLVINRGYTARMLVTNQYFVGRTCDSIAQQIRRQRFKLGR